ncbi:MAG: AAA family ATPase [Muricoprocola sp.]
MRKINIPVGISDFEKIRRNNYYYVDKSALISELLKAESTEVTLITRPRRFGKTLGMSMLASFFDIRKDNRCLFNGLEIAEDTKLCNKWMNQWPTLFLSFKDVDGTTFENAFGLLKFTISQLCEEHAYLEESDKVTTVQKEIFRRLRNQSASLTDIQGALFVLMKMMQAHYGKPVILLLDEYDVPIAKASSKGYYAEMLEVIKTILSTALKDNTSLCFAVVTGCLKIAKESIFTGTNNFVSDTITSSRLNEYFGFTQKDVDQLLQDADVKEHSESLREWYDGYLFGNIHVYCPWDVMNYLRDLQQDPSARPAGYWKNTSDNAIIRSFIDYAGSSISMKLETLMAGGDILQPVEEDLSYDYLHSSEDNLWSILYLTGYLTKADVKGLPENVSALRIPNSEIKEIYETTVLKWFHDSTKTWNRKELFHAVWNGDSSVITEKMNALLRKTISYHDYREDFYHAFLAGIFTGAGYVTESNKEHGEGRSDLVVYDSANGRVAVFEAKYSRTLDGMADACERALNQIDERMYAAEFEDNYDHILCYGISFYKKRCLVRKKEL